MEFGARALGNRSIIANPCNPKIKKIINQKLRGEKISDLLLQRLLKKKKKFGLVM